MSRKGDFLVVGGVLAMVGWLVWFWLGLLVSCCSGTTGGVGMAQWGGSTLLVLKLLLVLVLVLV